MLKIALTGGISSGKSTSAKILQKNNINVISLDEISKNITKKKSQALKELTAEFGDSILTIDKNLNRAELKRILFNNTKDKEKIEKILHPKIFKKMQSLIKQTKGKIAVVEIPLLIEKNWVNSFDICILIDCSEQNQMKRLLKYQNIEKDLAMKIIKNQATRSEKLKIKNILPTYIINNDNDLNSLEQKIIKLSNKLLNL
jgi:dephospho-CoA kinase